MRSIWSRRPPAFRWRSDRTRQINAPTATTCQGTNASVSTYSYATTNNQLLDISPTGNMCAGTWNRNSGGGIPDFTICNPPSPLPSTDGLPYATAYISASANSVTSNPVEVYVHAQVSSVALALSGSSTGSQQCYSQGASTQLDSEACYASNGTQYEFCAPATVTQLFVPGWIGSRRYLGSELLQLDRCADLCSRHHGDWRL